MRAALLALATTLVFAASLVFAHPGQGDDPNHSDCSHTPVPTPCLEDSEFAPPRYQPEDVGPATDDEQVSATLEIPLGEPTLCYPLTESQALELADHIENSRYYKRGYYAFAGTSFVLSALLASMIVLSVLHMRRCPKQT